MISGDYKMTAQTMFGLEEVLATELRKLGAREVEQHNRAVSFVGDIGFMYKANLCLYTALRILVPIKTFNVRNEQDLYDEIKSINWETYMGVDDTLAVNCSLNSELFNHSQFLSQKTKDA
ncbi:MAG: class I SAM-dependent RNA methyltransferase, partial [Bacteroidia bacterium]|nr:class I SAM-dependent RNA methyltransferase [Bacteroidia bacterium]